MSDTEKTTKEPIAMWCTHCGVRLRRSEISGWGCPKCGNPGIPCDPAKDVFVEVNWHELHILGCFAERWAEQCAATGSDAVTRQMPKTVYAIARRLEHQWPHFGRLTLGGEIADLPEDLAERGITIDAVESNIPKQKPMTVIGPGAVGFAKMKETNDEPT
jgi:hypothetical protein